MALFRKSKEGGFLDVIRSPDEDYLIWKWSPTGEAGDSRKENAIRYGSSLRVKDGEVAVFVYKQQHGPNIDFIEGPYDDVIKTANFPILSNVVGMAFGGASPFQAEVYFINLAGNQKRPFGVPAFNVADPREPDLVVPVGLNGSYTYNITDYRAFIKLHRLVRFDPQDFSQGVQEAVMKIAKSVTAKAPRETQINLVRINEELETISDLIQSKLRDAFAQDFGVNLKRFDLSEIWVDEYSDGYKRLCAVTIDARLAQAEIAQNRMRNADEIETEHMAESLAIQREQAARFSRLQTQSQFLGAHQVNVQGMVLTTAADNLGQMGSMNLGSGGGGDGGGGFNPVGIMTGMAVGGAMGGQMARMMGGVGQSVPTPGAGPPPIPQVVFNVAVNGQSMGPFTVAQLQQMILQEQMGPEAQVWKEGMPQWAIASTVPELTGLFAPPPSPQTDFYILILGQGEGGFSMQQGPFSLQQLQLLAKQGQLLRETQVWASGMAGWAPAGTVQQLAGLFLDPAPPPPPPPPPPSSTQ
jgi:membrane protease subunit (stomatin/prohibitin family)